MTDNRGLFVFEFLDKIFGTGERNPVDVLFNFRFRHSDSVIDNFDGFFLFIRADFHLQIFFIYFCIDRFSFTECIDSVGNKFSQKNIVLRIEPFFDNRENILGMNRKISTFFIRHNYLLFRFLKIK